MSNICSQRSTKENISSIDLKDSLIYPINNVILANLNGNELDKWNKGTKRILEPGLENNIQPNKQRLNSREDKNEYIYNDSKELIEDSEFGINCPICLQTYKGRVYLLPCYHSFCLSCIYSYIKNLESKYICPLCRGDLKQVIYGINQKGKLLKMHIETLQLISKPKIYYSSNEILRDFNNLEYKQDIDRMWVYNLNFVKIRSKTMDVNISTAKKKSPFNLCEIADGSSENKISPALKSFIDREIDAIYKTLSRKVTTLDLKHDKIVIMNYLSKSYKSLNNLGLILDLFFAEHWEKFIDEILSFTLSSFYKKGDLTGDYYKSFDKWAKYEISNYK